MPCRCLLLRLGRLPEMEAIRWLTWLILGAGSDSIMTRVYVQAHLAWYSASGASDLSNRLVRMEAIQRLGLAGERLGFEWFRIEAVRGERNWGRHDSILTELQHRGLKAYGVIAYSPSWAVPSSLTSTRRMEAHRPFVDGSSARGDTAFAAFAAASARRYKRRINRWEIWNEENHPDFWFHVQNGTNLGPDPADYARLFLLARDSILVANPVAEVAVGGLAAFDGLRRVLADPLDRERHLTALPGHAFLRATVAAGLRPSAVAIHPYSTVPPGVTAPGLAAAIFPTLVVDSVFAVLDEARLPTASVWVTEWGVNVQAGLPQAEVDAWFHDALANLLCRPRVPFVTIHTLTDVDGKTHFGLLNPDGTETRAAGGLRHLLMRWTGCGGGRG